jgi:hypothetical protein
LETLVVPNGNLSRVWSIPGLSLVDNCADTNCQPLGSASALSYSLVAMIVGVVLSLAALF